MQNDISNTPKHDLAFASRPTGPSFDLAASAEIYLLFFLLLFFVLQVGCLVHGTDLKCS